MMGKRCSPGSDWPINGLRHIRLMWSAISINVPPGKVRRTPPAALVTIRIWTPSSANTRAGRPATAAEWPSYK